MTNNKLIYADNAATTAVSDSVMEAMLPYFQQHYGNPSSIYRLGREASMAVEKARDKVAEALNADPYEIFFTSGGSEADNWAIKGVMSQMIKKGKKHVISTEMEHHAVLHTLQSKGYDVTLLPIGDNGIVSLEDLKNAVREDTALVTIMYANNEIGTIQPIKEIGAFCKERGIIFHTDAVQAIGNVEIDVKEQNIDLLSLSAHKIHGAKGVGALYVKKGIRLPNLIDGGAQERNKRAGTENVPGIVGLGVAIEDATKDIAGKDSSVRPKSQKLMDELLKIDRTRLNGDRDIRLPGNVNISFEGIEGESLLLLLDNAGIAASSGSACTSGALDPSHVLLALGLPHEVAHGSLRLSINEQTTDEEIDYIIEQVKIAVDRLRVMSPLWDKIIAG